MQINATIQTALTAAKPTLIESFEQIVRSTFERIVAQHGTSLRGVHNCWTFAKVYNNTVRAFVEYEGDRITTQVASISASKLAQGAARYADEIVLSWTGKILSKLEHLDNAEVTRISGTRFVIVGQRGGQQVRIEQDMIINVSSAGKLFNQFPARIYVDGKFTSEAKYKKAFAA